MSVVYAGREIDGDSWIVRWETNGQTTLARLPIRSLFEANDFEVPGLWYEVARLGARIITLTEDIPHSIPLDYDEARSNAVTNGEGPQAEYDVGTVIPGSD